MADYGNYVVSENPFHLAGPPGYWLKALYDFDNSLLVMPSKQGFYYRVCQRRPPTHTSKIIEDVLKEDADARMMASHGVIPVTTLLATTNWSNYPLHLEELRKRAPWRMGGAEAVTNQLEQSEWMQEQQKRQQFSDDVLTPLSKDAWGMYNKKLGLRSHMYIPKTSSATPISTQLKMKQEKPGIKVGSIFLP